MAQNGKKNDYAKFEEEIKELKKEKEVNETKLNSYIEEVKEIKKEKEVNETKLNAYFRQNNEYREKIKMIEEKGQLQEKNFEEKIQGNRD